MLGSTESRRYSVLGYIISIKTEGLTYRAHEPSDGSRCMKKVIEGEQEDTFKCVKCNKNALHDSETTHRYTMQVGFPRFYKMVIFRAGFQTLLRAGQKQLWYLRVFSKDFRSLSDDFGVFLKVLVGFSDFFFKVIRL